MFIFIAEFKKRIIAVVFMFAVNVPRLPHNNSATYREVSVLLIHHIGVWKV